MLTLEQWDAEIAPHLHGIEAGAQMAARHVGQLVYQPKFETLAAEELVKLQTVLDLASAKVRAARRAFAELPVDG